MNTHQRFSTKNTTNSTNNLHTQSGEHPLRLKIAKHFISRFKGLMLAAPLGIDEGLLLTKCTSVHTAFMRYAIDVIYLNAGGQIVKCVKNLKPWRGSFSQIGKDMQGRAYSRASHTLELPAGSINRLGINIGDRLDHPVFTQKATHKKSFDALLPSQEKTKQGTSKSQRGSALIEFVVVGPTITLVGMAMLQYGMLFFAKNHMNHASFMAARAGSVNNASISSVQAAYTRALIPIYGGGTNSQELTESLAKATADVTANARIELLNPTQESFKDWNDPELQALLKTGTKKVIPNAGQGFKNQDIGATSGQTIQDANMIKLRITHGYEAKVPFVSNIYKVYLQWLDTKTDAFQTQLINAGRIPVVTNVTLQMQSDAIEGTPISVPGKGNDGKPVDPGDPPVVAKGKEPTCNLSGGCGSGTADTNPNTGGTNNGTTCPGGTTPAVTTLSTDTLFAFGKSSLDDLQPGGIAELDKLIAEAKKSPPKTVEITGYTDQLGSDAINIPLSLARANTIKAYLEKNGFPSVPITTIGAGAKEPKVELGSCPSSGTEQKDCLAKNRRVTVKLTY